MKLPVLQIVTAAYAAVAGNIVRFFLSAIPALILIVALWLIRLSWHSEPTWIFSGWLLIDSLPYIFFGLVWFRLHESPQSPFPMPLFGSRSAAYFALASFAFLLIWLPILYFAVPLVFDILETMRVGAPQTLSLQFQGFILLPGVTVLWLYLLSRFSQMLPAAAFDEALGPRACWRATAGNGVRLLATYLMAGLPVLVLVGLLAAFALWRGHWDGFGGNAAATQDGYAVERALTGLANAFLRLALAALLATVAAEAYRRLVKRQARHQT